MQPKAKYHLSADAVKELSQLNEVEDALKVLTAHYNELRESAWERMRQAYFLDAGKQYEYDAKNGLIKEV